MPTTTNFGWTTPADTDLVKDGAAAIRTLAGNIDTSLVDLKGGTTGQVLAKNSNTDLDFVWSSITAGSLTSLETGSLSGASVTTATLSGSYRNLYVVIKDLLPATDATALRLRFNADTNARYNFNNNVGSTSVFDETSIAVTATSIDNSTSDGLIVFTVPEYANTTTWKYADIVAIHNDSTTPTSVVYTRRYGFYNQTGAITSLTFFMSSGNFTSGTYTVYGVN